MESENFYEDAKKWIHRGEMHKIDGVLQDVLHQAKEVNDHQILIKTYFYLATIFSSNGEIAKAVDAFKKVLSLDPSHTNAQIALSVLYNDVGEYEEGAEIFEKASQQVVEGNISNKEDINKKFSLRHFEIARMYDAYNRFDEALFEYEKVVQLDPLNLDVRVKIAQIYAKKNFIEKAFEEFKKLKNEYPDYIFARIELGVLYYERGKVLEAQSEWQNVLSIAPNNREVKKYLKNFDEVKEICLT